MVSPPAKSAAAACRTHKPHVRAAGNYQASTLARHQSRLATALYTLAVLQNHADAAYIREQAKPALAGRLPWDSGPPKTVLQLAQRGGSWTAS